MTTAALPVIDPKRTTLLVMDVQNGVVGSISESDALLERVKRKKKDGVWEVRVFLGP